MFVQDKLYTAEELWEISLLPENADKRLELLEGVIHEVPSSFIPSQVAIHIAAEIRNYLKKNKIGYLTGADGGYVMSEHNVFVPDVGYISKIRLPEKPARNAPLPPDFAVEVVSPTDSLKGTHKKAMQYLAYGTQLVWIVDPEEQTVEVYRPAAEGGANVQVYRIKDTLEGYNILPQFTLAVKDIFED